MFLIFLLWWLPSLALEFTSTCYNMLWILIYFVMTIGIFSLFWKQKINRNFLCLLLLNYLYHHSFRVFFIYYDNTFYSVIILLVSIALGLIWFFETRKLDKRNSLYLLPYLFGTLSLIFFF